MTSQESKLDMLTSRMSKTISDYWNAPKGSLRRSIERCLASFERIPADVRQQNRIVTLSDGTQVQYSRAIEYMEINLCRIAGRGYDLSAYKPRVAVLKGY